MTVEQPTADADADLPELTLRGIVLGAFITIIFTASNVYLGLKVGLTFASSIPAAVISMAALRFLPNSNILENNMVQTQASAAGTLSSIIFIVPGLVMVGFWHGFPFWQTAGIAAAGGVLGVMYTIPLRRTMVVESALPYPEGVAAAEILRVGSDTTETRDPSQGGVRDILVGGVAAAFFTLMTTGFQLFADEASWWFRLGTPVFRIGAAFSLALLGAGYLVGMVAGLAMLTGVMIAWGICVPILTTLHPVPPGADIAAAATAIWRSQVRLIGAGTIAIGAVWTLIMLAGPVITGVRHSIQALGQVRAGGGSLIPRTERDIPIHLVAGISLLLALPLAGLFARFALGAPIALDGTTVAALVVAATVFTLVFGFLVGAASGYMAGIVGSTNSPISGIGILGVTLVSLLTLALFGRVSSAPGGGDFLAAFVIFITSAILATATVANDNLQDLKTGWLVGATPWRQQVALVFGILAGALVIPPVLDLLYTAYGFPGALPRPDMDPAQALAAPQAVLMTALARGIITHALDWTMIVIGLALGAALVVVDEALSRLTRFRLPVLAVGIGIYLPPAVTSTLVIGAVIGWLAERWLRRRAAIESKPAAALLERARQRGTLVASGMIVGESLIGVAIAAAIGATGSQAPLALVGPDWAAVAPWLGASAFAIVAWRFAAGLLRR